MNVENAIIQHYNTIWGSEPQIYIWHKGPLEKISDNFRVLEYRPTENRNMWTYATSGLSCSNDRNPIELHLFSSKKDDSIVELFTSIAYYHQNTAKLSLHHTINFGKSWQENSISTYGLISLPYLDGPDLEKLHIGTTIFSFYWLIPITEIEVNFKKRYGIEALEVRFDDPTFIYLDPNRKSMV